MAFEQKPNSGSLFRNLKKKSGDNKPDYTGKALIDGVEYKLSAWLNEIKSGNMAGKKFFNIKFTPDEEQQQSTRGNSRKAERPQDDDDDIPF